NRLPLLIAKAVEIAVVGPVEKLATLVGTLSGEQVTLVIAVEVNLESLAGGNRAVDEVGRGLQKLFIDRLHALLCNRCGILAFLFTPRAEAGIGPRRVGSGRDAPQNATRTKLCLEGWVLGIIRVLRLILGIQMIEVAEEHVEAVHRRQELVAVAEMILA